MKGLSRFFALIALCTFLGVIASPKPAQAGLAVAFMSFDGCNECAIIGLGTMIAAVPVGISVGISSGILAGLGATVGLLFLNEPIPANNLVAAVEYTFPRIGSTDVREKLASVLQTELEKQNSEMTVVTANGVTKEIPTKIVKLDRKLAYEILSQDVSLTNAEIELYLNQLSY